MVAWRPALRKIAPVILLLGGVAIGAKLCDSQHKLVQATIRYELGDGFDTWKELAAEYRPEGQPEAPPVALFRTSLLAAEVTHRTRLKAGGYDVAITMTAADGAVRTFSRRIDVAQDATIRIDLAP